MVWRQLAITSVVLASAAAQTVNIALQANPDGTLALGRTCELQRQWQEHIADRTRNRQ
ncbi:uncharacterized protein K489DRAFT_381137 [Dissoconium aciculare CBS 342.82]|uniref:Uncharacterized protein n=1 Tax=Dissoconium aciculare CBS 342.82 TaxID=1314786 RepID=A0A6J3M2Y2_9PEZI|nr:uncharacterized protein K489DRAFT_381137 [Dissoconium aciculare CBS 342.82]KAF1822386.1 hypothetical protein K489DRAFT_381137 [Dissoconium aciculare CBS 342.82]